MSKQKTENAVSFLINRAARLLMRRTDVRLQELGLASAQIPVLGTLRDGVPRTQTELARLARIEQPTMAQLLVRMERDGLVQRTPDPNDKRSSLVSPTPLAKKKMPAARNVLLQGNEDALAGFTPHEIATLDALLARVVANLDPESPEARPFFSQLDAGDANAKDRD